jgi:enterochelin esterase-like enzyme
MGGGQALAIGLRHLDLFSRVAGFSAAVNRNAAGGPFTDLDARKVNGSLKLLWLGCGDQDSLFKPNQDLSAHFKSKGITHTFHPSTGAHTWSNWRKYLAEIAPQLWATGARSSATGR